MTAKRGFTTGVCLQKRVLAAVVGQPCRSLLSVTGQVDGAASPLMALCYQPLSLLNLKICVDVEGVLVILTSGLGMTEACPLSLVRIWRGGGGAV